ncbi:MAG: Co2+/Mg2+ efflux protein ApaG [Gemmatimonadota bacterium]
MTETPAMRIRVEPYFLAGQSDPRVPRYVFPYNARIENAGREPAQLYWRHWIIHDPVAGDQEVQGEGVVGESPLLRPGEVHEYQSFCVLESPIGHMEGFYHFRREDGSTFRAPIPRFTLQAPMGRPDA